MIDLVDSAAAHLRERGFDVSLKRLDEARGREGIVLRRIASIVRETYMDGEQALDVVFQAIAVSHSELCAMQSASDIAEALVNVHLESKNGSFECRGVSLHTAPQELAFDQAGMYAWEVKMKAEVTAYL